LDRLLACLFFYGVRMFGITGGYHRYFSHRSYKTGRVFQFILALIGASSAQLGPLWWAAHHRHHHRHSDTDEDIHSPGLRGLWWAHVGWVLCKKYNTTRLDDIKDFAKFPELRLLDRYSVLAPIGLAVFTFGLGAFLELKFPALRVTAFQMLVWGFFVSTVCLYHGTFSINSLAHIIGKRRFQTTDHSKNHFLLAIVTLGEGWHNNHHRYPLLGTPGHVLVGGRHFPLHPPHALPLRHRLGHPHPARTPLPRSQRRPDHRRGFGIIAPVEREHPARSQDQK
jgi:stearoyl-CoA desaturase (delta-9 desaturase)